MSALAWVLASGAAWRLTLLVTADEIARPVRARIRGARLGFLFSCSWCMAVWVSPPVVASGLAWSNGWGWQLAAGSLSIAALVGFLSAFASPDG